MSSGVSVGDSEVPNPPKSVAMALVAFLTFNIGMGSVMGTPGVLLPHMMRHLGVSIEMASAGMALVVLCTAIFAPTVGSLVVRRSLRGVLAVAALLLAGAWAILAFTRSYALYLAVYGLMLGPVTAITGTVLPPTLVTRWFNRNRGLALGLVHIPIMVAIMPPAIEWLIQHVGLRMTFLSLAGLSLVTLLPASFLIIDWPPRAAEEDAADAAAPAPHEASFTVPRLLRAGRFWALAIGVGVPNTSSMLLALHLVSMVEHGGIAPLAAASLASIMSLGGMAGTVAIGWIADRIGGGLALALISACNCLLWLLFLAGLPYVGLAAVVATIGLFGAGTVPAVSKALADSFGQASFSRAVGLLVPATLPLLVIGQIGPGVVVRLHGDYTPVVLVMSGAFLVAALLVLWVARPSTRRRDRAMA